MKRDTCPFLLAAAEAPSLVGHAAALDRAMCLAGRVLLGDFSDADEAGAPCSGSSFLRAMIERGVRDAVIGCLCDPRLADLCADAGAGATLRVRLGDPGDPLELPVAVIAGAENHSQGNRGARQSLGRSVWLRSQGIDIAVCSIRAASCAADAFTGLGLRLDDKRLVVVKSSGHDEAAFWRLADALARMRPHGAAPIDFAAIPHASRPRFR